jgi:hypothetical protein
MKEIPVRRTLAILASAAVAMSTVALASPARAEEKIPAGGASFPFVFISQCAADFNASQNNFSVTYTSTGSGTGKGNFAKGTFVTAMTDSKFSSGEPSWDWEYIPAIGGAITVPINLKNAKTGRTLGSSIQLKQVTLAKIFFTLEGLGVEPKLTPEVFTAIHKNNVNLTSEKAFFDWAASKGLDRKKVEDMYNSFAIQGKLNKAKSEAQKYNVQSVPMIVVDGKFVTATDKVGSHAALPPAIDALIAKARAERPKS